MKGVILAGGLGSRLSPLTQITNKHLLPVWDMPMIHYPIENLVKSGIEEIMIVTGGQHAGHFIGLLKNGKEYGLKKLEYAYQEGEGGIADALKLARDFVKEDNVCVMLGDNIYQYNVRKHKERYERQGRDAMVVAIPASGTYDPTRFGVVTHPNTDGSDWETTLPVEIVEKPTEMILGSLYRNDLTVSILTGCYFYNSSVFDICEQMRPSGRGELEISDVNSFYLMKDKLLLSRLAGWWSDAGTFPSLFQATTWVQGYGANHVEP